MTYPPIQQEQNPEDYRPEGMPKLEVGMRVRWRISPECGLKCTGCKEDSHIRFGLSGEGELVYIVGVNIEGVEFVHDRPGQCGSVTPLMSHTYGVFVNPDAEPGNRGFWAAASELQVLGPDVEDTRREEGE